MEIEDHFNLLVSPFGTNASGAPEFTYEALWTYFLYLPTSSRSAARFGDDWWRLQVNPEQIISGGRGDSQRLYQCERPEFLGVSAYLELVVQGDATETAAVRAKDGELIEDHLGSASVDFFFLMRSLSSLVQRAKDDAGFPCDLVVYHVPTG